MSLPLPPPLVPLPPKAPNWDERFQLKQIGNGKAELRVDGITAIINRRECFFLVGKLERMGATL